MPALQGHCLRPLHWEQNHLHGVLAHAGGNRKSDYRWVKTPWLLPHRAVCSQKAARILETAMLFCFALYSLLPRARLGVSAPPAHPKTPKKEIFFFFFSRRRGCVFTASGRLSAKSKRGTSFSGFYVAGII